MWIGPAADPFTFAASVEAYTRTRDLIFHNAASVDLVRVLDVYFRASGLTKRK
jgi:hypothetical protein